MRSDLIKKLAGVLVILGIMAHAAEARVVVMGIDETGSYDFRMRALAVARNLIDELEPGDVLFVRLITHKSYSDSCAVLRLPIPQVPPMPANHMDLRAKNEARRQLAAILKLKARAKAILDGLKPVKAPNTDIFGFLAAASDRIGSEGGAAAEPVIVIASDMADNCRVNIRPDLHQAAVIVAGYQSGDDPVKAAKLKNDWEKILKEKCRAAQVRFVPADGQVTLTTP